MPGYVERHSRCLAKGALQSLHPSHWHHCLSPACHRTYFRFEFAARCPLQAPGRRVSYSVTEPFPFLRPGHCVDVSLLSPSGCRREALPRRRLAHRARSRAFGNLSTNARHCSRPHLCSSVEKATALCGESLKHHVCECATRCESLVA